MIFIRQNLIFRKFFHSFFMHFAANEFQRNDNLFDAKNNRHCEMRSNMGKNVFLQTFNFLLNFFSLFLDEFTKHFLNKRPRDMRNNTKKFRAIQFPMSFNFKERVQLFSVSLPFKFIFFSVFREFQLKCKTSGKMMNPFRQVIYRKTHHISSLIYDSRLWIVI